MTAASSILADDLRKRFDNTPLRIGTRTTPLAQAQTRRVMNVIESVAPGLRMEIMNIETSADLRTSADRGNQAVTPLRDG